MKKLSSMIVLLALAGTAFAIDLGAGTGITLGSYTGTTSFAPYFFDSFETVLTTVPFGIAAFFDATYGVASVGLRTNGNTHLKVTNTGVPVFGTTITESDDGNRSGFLSLSLLGRYPFTVGPVSLFPLLGIEYDQNLYYRDEDGNDLKASLTAQEVADLNQFWFKAGAGADFVVYKGLYFRPTVLMGFKVLNQGEKDAIDSAVSGGSTTARTTDFVFEAGVQAGWRF